MNILPNNFYLICLDSKDKKSNKQDRRWLSEMVEQITGEKPSPVFIKKGDKRSIYFLVKETYIDSVVVRLHFFLIDTMHRLNINSIFEVDRDTDNDKFNIFSILRYDRKYSREYLGVLKFDGCIEPISNYININGNYFKIIKEVVK